MKGSRLGKGMKKLLMKGMLSISMVQASDMTDIKSDVGAVARDGDGEATYADGERKRKRERENEREREREKEAEAAAIWSHFSSQQSRRKGPNLLFIVSTQSAVDDRYAITTQPR